MREVVARQVPEIGTRAHINPGFWNGYNEAAASKSQVMLKYDELIVIFIFVALSVCSPAMLGQDIVASNTQGYISILHQQWDICSTLEDHLQIWHTAHMCQVLTWIVTAHFHPTFIEKRQRFCLHGPFPRKLQSS